MKFGPVPLEEAAGAVLAHSVAIGTGRLRKGHVLTANDLKSLQQAGHDSVIVARLDPDDLDENTAAAQLATALAGQGVRISVAATGRVNLFATGPGIAELDVAAIGSFNAINPMITVATVPQYHRMEAGGMIATIKIISYAVPARDVVQTAKIAEGAVSVASPRFVTATLIETRTDQIPPEKGRNALRARLDRLGLSLDGRVVVDHRAEDLRGGIAAAEGQVIFILTASATSDPADVGPEGLRLAGGMVNQVGMPVDPGNLLFLGHLGERPVIGLPGCARSPALNGADWVMERVICGINLTPADFASMGVGGLLKEIPTRPKPRGEIGG